MIIKRVKRVCFQIINENKIGLLSVSDQCLIKLYKEFSPIPDKNSNLTMTEEICWPRTESWNIWISTWRNLSWYVREKGRKRKDPAASPKLSAPLRQTIKANTPEIDNFHSDTLLRISNRFIRDGTIEIIQFRNYTNKICLIQKLPPECYVECNYNHHHLEVWELGYVWLVLPSFVQKSLRLEINRKFPMASYQLVDKCK